MLVNMQRLAVRMAACMVATALALSAAGCGCSAQNAGARGDTQSGGQTTSESSATSEEGPREQVSIEQPATDGEEAASAQATFVNETGYDIKTISLKAAGAATYDAEHVIEDANLPNGAQATLRFRPVMQDGAAVQRYDMRLTTTDDGIIECLDFDLVGSESLTLRFEDGIGYVSFVDAASDEVVDNREESEQAQTADNVDIVTYDMENQMG